MRLAIEFSDGSKHDAVVKASDLVAFERKFGIAWPGDDARLEHVLFVAWNALRRAGDTAEDFDAWIEAGVDIADDEGAAVPLAPPSA